MVSRLAILSSIGALILFLGCDSPPKTDLQVSNSAGGNGGLSNPDPNPVTATSEDPPGTVNMTPPVAADADATQQLKLVMRGMNLGNFLDGPTESLWTGNALHGWYFQAIKEAGFDNVRIPVQWNAHASQTAPDYTIDPTFFDRVDWAIAHTLTRGMAAVLDIHHYDDYYKDPAGQHDRFLALWKQIASHYKNYPKQLIFEVLNEPQGSALRAGDIWNADMTAVVAEIRTSNPYRTLMVGGVNYNNSSELYGNRVNFPAGDKNIIATYHYYNPYCFTLLQSWDCHGWDMPDPLPATATADIQNVKWPVLFPQDAIGDAGADEMAANNRAAIDSEFSKVADWSKTTGIPVYLGEFGADGRRDIQSRASYVGYVAREAEKFGFGWAHWSFIYNLPAWNNLVGWYPEMITALIPEYVVPSN